MKRAVLCTLALALVLAGCQGAVPADGSSRSQEEEPELRLELERLEELPPAAGEEAARAAEDPWGLALSVRDATPDGLTLVITQSGGVPTGALHYGEPYRVESRKDGVWREVPLVPCEGNRVWFDIAYTAEPEKVREQSLRWEWLYGSLPAGTYRIVKEFSDFRATGDYDTAEYAVEFEVA